MQLEISETAYSQIKEIYEYGQKYWGIDKSDAYLRSLFDTFEMLQQYPNAGRKFNNDQEFLKNYNLFHLPHESHQIFYKHDKTTLTILAIGSKWQLPDSFLG
ncbi:MAG: type II toxin-antitoxin system RelE/ParE family toxin [Robiginitomaculum sp.]|nr:type II toxin-antitoxin system RelE/ParE family toxin [Robiginitomaculum sp.]